MKKILAVILATVLAATLLTACGGSSGGSGSSAMSGNASGGGETDFSRERNLDEIAANVKGLAFLEDGQVYPAETVKIGIPTYNRTDATFIGLQSYCSYLEKYLNVEFIYSENLTDADSEIKFIENCAISGCKGILATYDVIGHDVIDLCAEYDMYYMLGPSDASLPEGDVYEAYKDNEYWLGGLTNGNSNYQASIYVADYLGQAGCKNIFYAAGMTMVPMFAQALAGFETTMAKYPDATYKVVEGLPDISADFQAAQKEALADPTLDGVAGLANPNYWAQPIADANRSDILLATGSGGLDETNREAMESGLMNFECIQLQEDFIMSVIMLLNMLEGDVDMARPNGVTELIDMALITVDNYDDYMEYYDLSKNEHFYDINDVTSCIKALNPNADFNAMVQMYQTRGIEETKARHASY